MAGAARLRVLGVALAAAILAGACGGSSGPAADKAADLTRDYLPGVAADVYLPATTGSAVASHAPAGAVPVVVLIPGGGWRTADRRGFAPLARTLAGDGMLVVNATYRAADDGVVFPTPVQDVVCAVAFAADTAGRHGLVPRPLVVLGHSSGGQLAALAALASPHFRGGCPYPPVQVDGLIGLSGAYDIQGFYSDVASALFGSKSPAAPAVWHEADPASWVAERTTGNPLSVLLAHGNADNVVPLAMTTTFGQQLRRAGHPVRVVVVPGADHATIYRPEVIGTLIRDWVRTLAAR